MDSKNEENSIPDRTATDIEGRTVRQRWQEMLYHRTYDHPLISNYQPYALAATIVFGLMTLQIDIEQYIGLNPSLNYADVMVMIEGNAVTYIQAFATPWLTYFSAFIYLIGGIILAFTSYYVATRYRELIVTRSEKLIAGRYENEEGKRS